jgi:hypothetical protein
MLKLFACRQEGDSSHFEVLVDMFLHYGIDHETMLRNLQSLINAAVSNQVTCLIHVFLPSYFAQAGMLAPSVMHQFLLCSARYYKKLYKQIDIPDGMQVAIVIPLISELHTGSIEHVIYSTVMQPVGTYSVDYAFANQNQNENVQLCALFNRKYTIAVQNIAFKAHDCRGCETEKNFTPYRLIKDYETLEKSAIALQLINVDLHNYLTENIFQHDFDEDDYKENYVSS